MELGRSTEIIVGYLVALAAGALIGIERERKQSAEPSLGGVRTYPLIALCGGVAAMFADALGAAPFVAGFAAVTLVLVAFRLRGNRDEAGITSEIAALATYLLGGLAQSRGLGLSAREHYLVVMAGAAVVMGLLSFREPLHAIAAKVTRDDIYATAKLAICAAVVLPLLPNVGIGPLGAVNPFKIGVFVVLVAGVGFVGYVAIRWVGTRRGLAVTGIVGGIVSSTAVTVGVAQRARKAPELSDAAGVAVIAAGATMFARILVIIALVDVALVPALAWPLGAMTLVGFVATAVLYRRSDVTNGSINDVPLRNPFALKPALQFGLLFALITVGVRAAELYIGRSGILASSVVAGTTDVDAIALSMAELHSTGLDAHTAALAIALAAITNTLVKIGIAFVVGTRRLGLLVGAGLGAALLAGVAAVIFH